MIIGFDGKRAVQNYTGLGNYSRYVLQVLPKYFPANEYIVYSKNPPDISMQTNFASLRFRHPDPKKSAALWRTFSIVKDLRKDGIELFHGLSNEIPAGLRKAGIASVVTIHDLIFLKFPQYYPLIDRSVYYFKAKYACENAGHIIAISEQTKKDIIQYFGTSDDKISVVYQNCDPIFQEKFSPESKENIRSTYKLPAKYILNVGTIEPRKNLLLIAKSLKLLPTDVHLVVVGKDTPYAEQVREYLRKEKLEPRVRFVKNVPFKDLPGIYQLAEIFIYPSRYEGFGIPVIEALHSGIPVIAATGSCLEEAGGPGSAYIDPSDEKGLADQILLILQNAGTRKAMVDAGCGYVNRFNDNAFAATLTEIYQKTIANA